MNFDNYTEEVNEWRKLVLQSRGIDAAQTLAYSGKIIAYGEQHNDAFLLGFGGLSVLLQVLSITSKTDLSIKPYIYGKFLHGVLAAFYTFVAINVFPFFNFNL